MGCSVSADRTQQQAANTAQPSPTHHQQVSVRRRMAQRECRRPGNDLSAHRHARIEFLSEFHTRLSRIPRPRVHRFDDHLGRHNRHRRIPPGTVPTAESTRRSRFSRAAAYTAQRTASSAQSEPSTATTIGASESGAPRRPSTAGICERPPRVVPLGIPGRRPFTWLRRRGRGPERLAAPPARRDLLSPISARRIRDRWRGRACPGDRRDRTPTTVPSGQSSPIRRQIAVAPRAIGGAPGETSHRSSTTAATVGHGG